MFEIDLSQLVVGLAAIDEEHESTVATWRDAARAQGRDFIARLEAFVEHLAEHFTREEALMREAADPNLAHHKTEHDRLLAEAAMFLGQSRAGKAHLARSWVQEMFPDWLTRHIRNMDSAAAHHIRRQDVSKVA